MNLRISRHMLCLAVVGVLSSDCAPSGDESADTGSPQDDTRVELVFVDEEESGSSDPDDTQAPALDAAQDSIPPAPTAEDEVGGDDLLAFDANGQFVVQVATFSNAKRAKARVRELEELGYPAFVTAHPSGSPLRVRIGYFATKADADRFGQRFQRDHGSRYWVDKRGGGAGANKVVSR